MNNKVILSLINLTMVLGILILFRFDIWVVLVYLLGTLVGSFFGYFYTMEGKRNENNK